jgi:DNA segregation ATPase FtsK/SpoIIIE, S-DNA-T family
MIQIFTSRITRNLLILVLALTAWAALPPDKAAQLDGSYAAINQKTLTALQQAVARGQMDAAKAKADIDFNTNAIKAARDRWANTPYQKIFEQSFQGELARKTPATTKQTTPVIGDDRRQTPALEITLPWWFKTGLFFVAVWACKKLWNKPAGSAKAVALDQYAPTELSSQERKRVTAAQEKRDQRLAQVEATSQSLRAQIQAKQTEAAALAGRALFRADALEAAAVSALNRAAPEFGALVANQEQRFPVAMAPWTGDVWNEIARNPKPETPWQVCVAHEREAGLAGEQGIRTPKIIPLLAGKGPIIIRCDPASKDRGRAVIHNILMRAAIGAPAEVRFSLIDPFNIGGGFPMRPLLPHVRPSSFLAADELAGIMEDIRRINEAVVGQAESFATLTREQRAGELFEIIAVLDYPTEYQRDPRTLDYLLRIGQSGPRAGRFLILEWNGAPSAADMARFQNAQIIDVAGAPAEWEFDPVAPPEMREKLLKAVSKVKSDSTGGDWNSLVRPQRFFAESGERMVGTPVGERLNMWFGESQEGKPCAHGMLAGQTGSGKSFLLHVFITGLVSRYSPDELQLVLVDGKQGVEFEHYRRLPHAQVVCLRTPPAIARSVLEDFAAEMDDRWEKFQQAGVGKLEEYRRKTGLKMPRMLMVVDEYQQLLEGDADRGNQLLTKVLEKGRAAGIHLLLGSQMFEVRGLAGTAMTHVHLRVALSLPGDYLQTMNAFSPEGKKLIRDLAPRGQVVINDEAGRDGANHRGAVARLDDAAGLSLPKIVEEITAAAGGPGAPVVLSGKDAAVLAENPFVEQWRSTPPDGAALQTVARKPVRDGGFGIPAWNLAERPLPLWLGRKFDVRGHMLAVLKRGPGQNLLAIGSNGSVRLGMLANAVAGLRSMRSMADCEILFLDGLPEGQVGEGMLAAGLDILRDAGARVERATPDAAGAALEKFAAAALQPRSPEAIRLLILAEPEYFPALAAPPGYGTTPAGAARAFKDLLRTGPAAGVHTIVTASGLSGASTVLGRDLSSFNHRISQQTNGDESIALFSKGTAADIAAQTDHYMAGAYLDMLQGTRTAQLFKAYAANTALNGDQSAAALRSALRALYGAASQGAGAP